MLRPERLYKKYGIESEKAYSEHFKFQTIEEICCKKYPHNIVAGLVLVIGTLYTNKEDKSVVFARNIPLNIEGVPYVENVSIRLLSDLFNDTYNKSNSLSSNPYLPTKGTFQIQGEVVLLNKLASDNHLEPITSTELTSRIKYTLAHDLTNETEVWKYIETTKNTYVPAIRVFFIRPVDQPLELIKSNLCTRLMEKFIENLSN